MADAGTTTMNVSLPEPLKRFVDDKVASGMYGSASEFVREAIREKFQREQEREQARVSLTGKVLEGLDSGAAIEFADGYAKNKKIRLQKKLGQNAKASE